MMPEVIVLLTKITAVLNEAALSYHRVSGLYFLAVIFESNIEIKSEDTGFGVYLMKVL